MSKSSSMHSPRRSHRPAFDPRPLSASERAQKWSIEDTASRSMSAALGARPPSASERTQKVPVSTADAASGTKSVVLDSVSAHSTSELITEISQKLSDNVEASEASRCASDSLSTLAQAGSAFNASTHLPANTSIRRSSICHAALEERSKSMRVTDDKPKHSVMFESSAQDEDAKEEEHDRRTRSSAGGAKSWRRTANGSSAGGLARGQPSPEVDERPSYFHLQHAGNPSTQHHHHSSEIHHSPRNVAASEGPYGGALTRMEALESKMDDLVQRLHQQEDILRIQQQHHIRAAEARESLLATKELVEQALKGEASSEATARDSKRAPDSGRGLLYAACIGFGIFGGLALITSQDTHATWMQWMSIGMQLSKLKAAFS